jgi:hypothetical protein
MIENRKLVLLAACFLPVLKTYSPLITEIVKTYLFQIWTFCTIYAIHDFWEYMQFSLIEPTFWDLDSEMEIEKKIVSRSLYLISLFIMWFQPSNISEFFITLFFDSILVLCVLCCIALRQCRNKIVENDPEIRRKMAPVIQEFFKDSSKNTEYIEFRGPDFDLERFAKIIDFGYIIHLIDDRYFMVITHFDKTDDNLKDHIYLSLLDGNLNKHHVGIHSRGDYVSFNAKIAKIYYPNKSTTGRDFDASIFFALNYKII